MLVLMHLNSNFRINCLSNILAKSINCVQAQIEIAEDSDYEEDFLKAAVAICIILAGYNNRTETTCSELYTSRLDPNDFVI